MILFFFFQAEDGIRDHCVTGVQTCALPICPVFSSSWRNSTTLAMFCAKTNSSPRDNTGSERAPRRCSSARPAVPSNTLRSEERRVGQSVDLGGRRILNKNNPPPPPPPPPHP